MYFYLPTLAPGTYLVQVEASLIYPRNREATVHARGNKSKSTKELSALRSVDDEEQVERSEEETFVRVNQLGTVRVSWTMDTLSRIPLRNEDQNRLFLID